MDYDDERPRLVPTKRLRPPFLLVFGLYVVTLVIIGAHALAIADAIIRPID